MSKSYLKWVGGKGQISEELIARFPENFERYIEAFSGSAALFFAYYAKQSAPDIFDDSSPPPALLNDTNPWLINCHKEVTYRHDTVKKYLDRLEVEHAKDPEGHYKRIRSSFQDLFDSNEIPSQRAAEFIYINKTCFNGLWRVNAKGEYNVPFNGKTKVNLYDPSLMKCSEMLKQYATISYWDFDTFIRRVATKGDFFFLDPPYVPISDTANFTGYTEGGWTDKDDEKLVKVLEFIDSTGAKFLMTNSDAPRVYALFGKWKIEELKVHRFVKALHGEDTREKVNETVITNY
jgi:DNA adenine methylase